MNAGVPETICANSTGFTLSGSATGLVQSGPVWSQVAGPSVIINDPSDLNTPITGMIGGNSYTFRLSADCTDGSAQFQDVIINVEPITLADAGSDLASCPDSSGALVINGNTPENPGESGIWTIEGANSAGVTIDFPSSPTSTIGLAEGNAGVTTLRWTITGPEYTPGQFCDSFSEITVTNYGGESTIDAGPDQTLDNCYTVSRQTNLNASFGGNGINGQQGTWSFVSGPSTPSFSNSNSNTSNVSNLIEGTYVLRWSVAGPCANGSDTLTINVGPATQDVTQAGAQETSIRFCDPSITTATLVGFVPQYSGETVNWIQTSGPTSGVNILDPNNSTTQISGLNGSSTYRFNYTITNSTTGCATSEEVVIRYSTTPISIIANGGADITAVCGQTEIDIPFTTTGNGSNQYSIISGPSDSSIVNPGNFQNTNSPATIDFDVEGTYTVLFRKRVSGSVQTGCDEATDAINVTISLTPTLANAGTRQVLGCNIDNTSVTGNEVIMGSSLWSQVDGPNTATIADPYARTTAISNLVPGIYSFRYGVSGGNACSPSAQSDVEVVVSSLSVVSDAGSNQSNVCFGTPVVMDATAPVSENLIGTWTVNTAPLGDTITFEDVNNPKTLVSGLDTANETYIFTWTVSNPDDNSCPAPTSNSVTITTGATQGPQPALAGSDQCLPNGTTSVNLNGNQPAVDETGEWTVLPNNGGITFVDSSLYNTTANVTANDSYILTWTLTKNASGCQSTSNDIEVTIGGDATADAGPDQSACASVFTMAATSSTGDGLWSLVSGPGGFTIDDETSPTAEFTFAFSGQYIFQWEVSNGNCTVDTDEVVLEVGIPSTTAIAGIDQVICNASNVVLSGNAFDPNIENGFWTLLSGAPNTPSFSDVNDPNVNVTGLVSGSYTFRWTIIGDPSCPSTFDDTVVDVFAPADAGPDQQLCDASNTLLEATFGSTGTWAQIDGPGVNGNPGTPATISQNPSNSSVAEVSMVPGNSYVFEFTTDYSPTCTNTSDTVTVNTSAGPPIPPEAGADQNVCIADTTSVTLAGNNPLDDVSPADGNPDFDTTQPGNSAFWRFASVPSGSVATFADTSLYNTTLDNLTVPGIYILEWNFSTDNCTDAADVLRIEVFEAPSNAVVGADQINACQLDAQLDAVAPAIGIGEWTLTTDPSGGDVVIDSPNSPTSTLSNITTLGTYVFTWTVTNGTAFASGGCAPSVSTPYSITFTDVPPSDADAGGDQLFCDATQTNLDATPLTTGTGTWTQTAGPGVSDAQTPANITAPNNPTSLILDLIPGTYEFTWTSTNGGCSLSDTMEVIIESQPLTAEAGPNQSLAEFDPVVLGATSPSEGTGIWSQISGPSFVNFIDETDASTAITGASVGTYIFEWTVSNGVCSDVSDTVEIEIVGRADLELTKSINPTSANAGDNVTFTITIFNNDVDGQSDADGISVRDIVPNGYSVVLGSVSNDGVYNPGNLSIVWSNLAVPNGATLDLTFEATINQSGSYLNFAEIIAANQFDPDSSVNNAVASEDDQDEVEVTIQSADLSLIKTVNPTDASVGDEVTFTLTLSNGGTFDATGVSLSDVLPSGYTLGTINNGGIQNGSGIDWTGLSVTASGTASVSFTATVDAPTGTSNEYLNTAEITASDQADPDSTPNNDNGDQSEDDESSVAIAFENIDLELTKSASSTEGNVGDQITVTLNVANDDTTETGNGTGITVVETLPNGFDVVGGTISNGGFYNAGDRTITWSNISVANGGDLNLSYEVTINDSGNYTSTAEITTSHLPDVDSTPNNGIITEDDYDTVTFTIQSADISLLKTVSPTAASVGDVVTFTLTVSNDGTANATGIALSDVLPSGYTLGTINNGGTQTGNTINWSGLSVTASGTTSVSLTATVDAPTGINNEYLNTAEITDSDQADPDSTPNNDNGDQSEDDESSAAIVLEDIDLELTKSFSSLSGNVGDQITATINVANNDIVATGNGTGITVVETLPNGFDIVGGSISNGGIYNPGNLTITWSNLSIVNGADLDLSYDVTINDSGNYTSVAEVTTSDLSDLDSTPNNGIVTEDDYDSATFIIEQADLSLVKTVSPSSASIGDLVTFTLTISNDGTANATGVALSDVLPSGYALGTINDGGVQSGNIISWSGLSVTAAGTVSVSLTATVNAPTGTLGEYLNTAEITDSDQADPDSTPNNENGDQSEDDESSAAIIFENIDLELNKTLSANDGNVGDRITVTINLLNNDTVETGDGTGITVVETLPDGFDIVGGTISNGGFYNAGDRTITWSNLSVDNGNDLNLSYDVTIEDTGNYTSVAEITTSDLPDVDSTPNNNVTTEDDYTVISFTIQSADLSLLKDINVVSSATPNVGDIVVFELTVTNLGPNQATNVRIEDMVPRGYTLNSINNGGTDIAGTFLAWNIANVPVGNTTVSYEVTVNAPTNDFDEYLNIAEIAASDQADPDSEPFNDDGDQSEDDEDFFEVTPQVIDLELDVSVNDSNPNVGDTVTFSVTLSNNGGVLANGVNIQNSVPPGFGNLVAISNGGAISGNNIDWSGLSVPVGSNTLVLTFDAEVLAPTGVASEYLNRVQVTDANQFDSDSTPNNDNGDQSEDDEDAVTVTIQSADLDIEKTANSAAPNVGETVVFTLTISNSSADTATGVSVNDVLPSGFNLTTVNNGGVSFGNTATWNGLSVLGNGGSILLTYEATVNAPTATPGEYVNNAQIIASDQYDPDSDPSTDATVDEDGNGDGDDDDETLLVLNPAIGDLSLTKIVVDNDINPDVGSEISFEITVFNDGPNDAANVEVEDLLPSGFDFVLYSATSGIYNENTGIWRVGTVNSGDSETLVIDVLVNATGDYNNIAEVVASDVFDSDSTPDNGLATEDDQDDVMVVPIEYIDISLSKTVDNETPDVGDSITFTLSVENSGPSEATNVQVLDILPNGFTYVSDNAGGNYDSGTGIWVIGNLAIGASISMEVQVTVNPTGSYVNTAEIISHTEVDEDSTPNNNVLTEDDQEQVIVMPRSLVDISVTKAADDMTPGIGSQINFTVTVTNDGPSDATNIVVTDVLESGYSFVSATPSTGVFEPLNGSWTIGNLANGATENIVITAIVLSEGSYVNTAELTDLNEFDIDSEAANNDATEDDQSTINPVPVLVSDLTLEKTVDNATPLVGENIEFTLNLTNFGPNDARGVTVAESIPTGYTYISHTSTAGDYDENTGIWDLNNVVFNNTTETLNILVTVNPIGDYSNVAEIIASDNEDPDSIPNNALSSEDDQDEQNTVPVPLADLALTKTVDKEFPDVSENVTFTITLTNDGPSEATGVVVTDLLQSGYTYLSDDGGGTYNSASGLWSIGDVPSGTSVSLNLTTGINTTGSYANQAEVTSVNELDPDSTPNNNVPEEDDHAEQSTTPRVLTDISVLKSVDNLNPSVGDQIIFTVEVTNDGPSDATGVIIEDIVASGYDFMSAVTSKGTYSEGIGSWDVGDLPDGSTETLEVTVVVLPNGNYTNIAELIALDTFDPDSSPDNNLNSEDDQDTVNPQPTGLADLSLTKEVNNVTPNVGDTVEFTINVTNSGDSNATGVVVTDKLPIGYTYVSHITTMGIYDEVSGEWRTNGTISNGTTETLLVLATVNIPSGEEDEYLNIAEVTASDQADPDSNSDSDTAVDDYADGLEDDDEASIAVVPQVTDISVVKTVNNTTPRIGENVIFSVEVSNESGSLATNIGIEDRLPTGYRFISATASNGVYDEIDGFWTIASLEAQASETLEITVEVLEPDDYLNIASLAFVDQIDSNETNDSAQVSIAPGCLHVFNEFSPNGDGVNEVFKIDCISRYPNNTLQVYNRWGNIVFEQNAYDNTWGGISNGRATINEERKLPVGTYYYILNLGDGSEPVQDWLYINE
ncbi:gliding motility-associated C-terminal domain-containing protein [Maribacter sp. 2307UL18-2]|uniref:T9SS type B sorting domain-containing protein n=1 Tax=Maribacter sp. 2307UL18-2 TaxID=3386274 RepID=UPI0039BD7288